MSATVNAVRKQRVLYLAAAVGFVWVWLGLLGLFTPSTTEGHPRLGAPVLTGFADNRSEVQKIRFTLADENYTLARARSGWVMPEASNYPVRQDRIAALANGLETLSFGARRTSDPYKLGQIGLADPAEGGNGVLVELIDEAETVTQSIIIGRKADQLYVRAPGDAQTYRANGTLPPFYARRAWLDFDILTIEPAAVSAVRLTDRTGASVYLKRVAGSDTRSFRPAPPNQNDVLISRLAASTTSLAITRVAPLDAKPQSALSTSPIGRHVSETFDGLEIDLQAYREADGTWITLRAVEAGEGARRAAAINAKAEGWAFRISEYDWQDFTPLVSSLVERAEPVN